MPKSCKMLNSSWIVDIQYCSKVLTTQGGKDHFTQLFYSSVWEVRLISYQDHYSLLDIMNYYWKYKHLKNKNHKCSNDTMRRYFVFYWLSNARGLAGSKPNIPEEYQYSVYCGLHRKYYRPPTKLRHHWSSSSKFKQRKIHSFVSLLCNVPCGNHHILGDSLVIHQSISTRDHCALWLFCIQLFKLEIVPSIFELHS